MKPFLATPSGKTPAVPFGAVDELAEVLAPSGQKRDVERGDRLFSFGDEAKGVYLIVSGTARLSLSAEQGRELVCHVAGPGSVLGLPAALCSSQYQFDAEALDKVGTLFLETTTVNEILRQRPALCMQVMSMMCDELSTLKQTTEHMRNCTKESCSLHEQCSKCG